MEKEINGIAVDINENEYSPLVLAYIGDAVYELYVRLHLVARANKPVSMLHKSATGYVKAKSQFEAFHMIEPILTDEEIRIFKRGRNAKSATVPKHADLTHYRHATGFEALVGYLYLQNKTERLYEILALAVDKLEMTDEKGIN